MLIILHVLRLQAPSRRESRACADNHHEPIVEDDEMPVAPNPHHRPSVAIVCSGCQFRQHGHGL